MAELLATLYPRGICMHVHQEWPDPTSGRAQLDDRIQVKRGSETGRMHALACQPLSHSVHITPYMACSYRVQARLLLCLAAIRPVTAVRTPHTCHQRLCQQSSQHPRALQIPSLLSAQLLQACCHGFAFMQGSRQRMVLLLLLRRCPRC